MERLFAGLFVLVFVSHCTGQDLVGAANRFIATLDAAAKQKALFPFNSQERYNFHFVPKDDRKGISWNALSPGQRTAAMGLLKSCLSERGLKKAVDIMQMETVLKALEGRSESDRYRDSGNYYFTLFGEPAANAAWGWRLEGHHLSFTFSADGGTLVSGTPGFMGANPAIVPRGPQAGKQILKEETDDAFALLHALSGAQLKKALIDTTAPGDILTFANRNAIIEQPAGILYSELNATQQQQLLKLIRVYVHRYTKLFETAMLNELEAAGLHRLRFAWAGATTLQPGKPHYYRIQGPTLIIEYDNTQNGANHIHSVLRDPKNDFGDPLLEHYKGAHRVGKGTGGKD